MALGWGVGKDFQCASELGWYQFNGDETEPRVADVVKLDSAYVEGDTEFRYGGYLLCSIGKPK